MRNARIFGTRNKLLIFPLFTLAPASSDQSGQRTSKQGVASSSLAGRATLLELIETVRVG